VGFIEAYRFAEGDPETMADLPATKTSSWADRRRQFVSRHLAQMRSSDTHGDGFKPDGTPTKRMLGLIAWAYIPPESTAKAKQWYKAGCPMKATRKRRNSVQSALFTEKMLGLPVVHFASGSNHPAEIRGFAALRKPVGVAASAIRKDKEGRPVEWALICKRDCEDALVEVARAGVPIFIDSGAFSEIDFGPRGPYDVLPIDHDEWLKRLALYERVVDRVGPENAHLVNIVAPDKVADQQTTLARMRTYGPIMRRLREKGASVLVPLQKAPPGLGMTIAQFHDAARDALGFPERGWVAAIPMKKDATTPGDLEVYLRAKKPERIHLLGVGPTSRRAGEIADAVRRGSPRTQVQGDSVLIRARVGRPKSGPKPLTAAQDVMRGEAQEYRFIDYPDEYRGRQGEGLIGYTDAIAEPSTWLSVPGRERIAKTVGLSREAARAWIADPDGSLQRNVTERSGGIVFTRDPDALMLYEHPAMDEALESEWVIYAKGAEVAPVKQIAIERVFSAEGAGPVSVYRNPGRREALLDAQILPVPKGADAMVRRMGRGNVGTLHRIILRGEAAQVPALSRLGYVRIVKVHPSGSTDAPWEVYDVRTTQRLHDAVKATQEAREAYRDEFQQVGLFGARRNDGTPSLFGTLPTRPAAAPAREVVPRGTDLFDTFAPLGAPAPGEKGYKPPPAFPRGAWDEQNPHEVAARLIDAAYHYLDEPETREMYEAAVEGRSEAAEEYEEIPFTLPDLLGVPYRDGRGSPMTMAEREAIAVTAMDYAMEGGDRAGGTAAYDVLDPGKSRRGPARPRSGRDQFGQIPRWAATAILGDRLASITPGYKNTLRLVNVGKETARRFIEKHHSALPYLNPAGMMYAIGAVKGDRLVAVATAGHPTGKWARRGMLDPRNIVELTRVASDGSVKGAASKLTGRLLRIVASSKRGDPDAPALFITYQLESESGTTYKALADMGLRPVAYLKGKEPSGKRAGGAAEDTALARVDKIRWEYSPSEGVALPAKWSLLEKQPVQGTLLGASRSNPSGWDDPRREGSEVQSVIFDAGRWTLGEARAWLRRHAYDGLDPDRTVNTLRFRQRDPARYRRDTFRTISMGDDTGIQAVVAVPR
jgi:hypothetical protein